MPGRDLPRCKDEALVGRILDAVVRAVDVPVTLKIRIGWNRENKNGIAITRIAESAGVQALAVHGRTRGHTLHRGGRVRHDQGHPAGGEYPGGTHSEHAQPCLDPTIVMNSPLRGC